MHRQHFAAILLCVILAQDLYTLSNPLFCEGELPNSDPVKNAGELQH